MVALRAEAFIFCVLLLPMLVVLGLQAQPASASSQITLLGLNYATRVPYDKPVVIDLTLAHNKTMMPSAAIYYAQLLNKTTPLGGWRVARPQTFSTTDLGATIYKFLLPYSAYDETFRYGARVVFYAEAMDIQGNTLLTSRAADRWDPLVQVDKFVVEITDPYPPLILDVKLAPIPPTSEQFVTVTAKVSDAGSGVRSVLAIVNVDGLNRLSLALNLTEVETYEARIPSFPAGTKVTLFVLAVDNAGNRITTGIGSYEVIASPGSYEVIASPEAILTGNLLLFTGLIIGVASLALIGVIATRRRSGAIQRGALHPKALTVLLAFMVSLTVFLNYQLFTLGAPLLGLLQAAALIIGWGLIDPRVDTLVPLKRSFDEVPPTSIVAEGYVLGLASALSLGAGYMLHLYSTPTLYTLATILASYVIFLLAVGIVLQILWPYLKEIEITVEMETNETKRQSDPARFASDS